MADSTKIELIDSGIQALLHEVGNTVCKEEAEKIAKKCGNGYASDVKKLSQRTVASAYTETPAAMADNQAHNTLAKAVR